MIFHLSFALIFSFCLIFLLFSKQKYSPAPTLFADIIFPLFSKRIIEQYQSNKTKNLPKLDLTLIEFGRENAENLPYIKVLESLISVFISATLVTLVFTPVCFFLQLSEINVLAMICYISLFVICICAASSSSFQKRNRNNSILYSIIILLISYFILSKFPLDGLDFRPLINSFIVINPRLLNFCISLFIAFICYCFANPALRYFEVFRVSTQIDKEVGKWRPCFETFKEFGARRETMTTLYVMMPVPTLLFFFLRRFVLKYDHDTLFDLLYLTIQLFIAIFQTRNLRFFLKMLVNDTYRFLTTFEEMRSKENGEMFFNELNRQLTLLANSAIALLAYPLSILLCIVMYILSLFMNNLFGTFTTIFSVFFVALIDILMSCNKFATLVIEP